MRSSEIEIAVVIPTHNRAWWLRTCLEAVERNLVLPGDDLEVVVVDDGSRDPVDWVLETVDLPVTLLRQDQKGPAAARNAGWRATRAPWVAFLDDDCVPRSDWLADLRAQLAARPHVHALGGRIEALRPDRVLPAAIEDCGRIDHQRNERYGWQLVTANAVFRRAVLDAVGGFDERYPSAAGEDFDLSRRLLASGHVIEVCDDATVYHRHPNSVAAVRRTVRRYKAAQGMLDDLDVRLGRATWSPAPMAASLRADEVQPVPVPPVAAPEALGGADPTPSPARSPRLRSLPYRLTRTAWRAGRSRGRRGLRAIRARVRRWRRRLVRRLLPAEIRRFLSDVRRIVSEAPAAYRRYRRAGRQTRRALSSAGVEVAWDTAYAWRPTRRYGPRPFSVPPDQITTLRPDDVRPPVSAAS